MLWVFFANSLQAASKSLLEAAALIRKTRFPRQLVPLSSVASNLVAFVVMFVVVLALNFIRLSRVRTTERVVVPLAAVFVLLVAGLALAVACATVVFRDVEHLASALLLPWFFLTPILYTIDNLPGAAADYDWLADLLRWVNFLAPPVNAIRDPLFFGESRAVADVVYLCVPAVAALALGAWASTASTTGWQMNCDLPVVSDGAVERHHRGQPGHLRSAHRRPSSTDGQTSGVENPCTRPGGAYA